MSSNAKSTAAKKKNRPPVSLNGADWVTSDAKRLMAQDMMDGLVPVDPTKDAAKLFEEMHAHQPEFADFPFDRERHKGRVSRLQKVARNMQWSAKCDKECLAEH